MADATLVTGMWVVAVLQLILEAGIVLYAYRLTRLTGSFRAWTMIILAFILTTASSVFGIFLLLLNPDLIAGLVQSISLPTLIVSYAVSIATSLLFFFGIFDLVRRFKHAANKPPGANASQFRTLQSRGHYLRYCVRGEQQEDWREPEQSHLHRTEQCPEDQRRPGHGCYGQAGSDTRWCSATHERRLSRLQQI